MAKSEQFFRLMLLAEFFKRKPKGVNFKEIENFLERKFEEKGWLNKLSFSEVTFKRERKELQNILGIKIFYNRSNNTYHIKSEELETETIFENILLIDAYRQVKESSEIMLFEKRKSKGLENLNDIINAIQKEKIITLVYTKYDDKIPKKRTLEPYALKEFNQQWYLLANERDSSNFKIKTFGLDRISELETSNSSFPKIQFDVKSLFNNSFGITNTSDEEVQEIILSFDPSQKEYLLSIPLHHSQEILIDNDSEFRIKLHLVSTFDFEKEILSYGEYVTVISPKNLRKEIHERLKITLKNY